MSLPAELGSFRNLLLGSQSCRDPRLSPPNAVTQLPGAPVDRPQPPTSAITADDASSISASWT